MRNVLPFLAILLAVLPACSGERDEQGRRRLFSREAAGPAVEASFDWSRPDAARAVLAMDAGEAARRLGALEWTAAATWTVTRDAEPPRRVAVAERHLVRQAADGAFLVETEIDPGEGAGARQGRTVVYVDGTTYARPLHAERFRARPTDRGRDAKRARDESFNLAADLARLAGPAFRLEPAGDATVKGRAAKRFRIALAKDAAAAPAALPPVDRAFGANGPDDDTRVRLAFLEGQEPLAASGELLADAATGAPLEVHVRAAYGLRGDPKVRAQVEVRGEVRATGAKVATIAAPKDPLPDERKPPGVSDALEAAGLKARDEKPAEKAEPPDEGE